MLELIADVNHYTTFKGGPLLLLCVMLETELKTSHMLRSTLFLGYSPSSKGVQLLFSFPFCFVAKFFSYPYFFLGKFLIFVLLSMDL